MPDSGADRNLGKHLSLIGKDTAEAIGSVVATAKVDDLELAVRDDGDPPYVSAVLCGPLAFGPRLGGRLGRWWTRTGEVFQPSERPDPVRIDFGLVAVGQVSLRVAVPEPDVLGARRLELWLREHLIVRIPGARA